MTFSEMQTDVKAYSGEQSAVRIKAAINASYRLIRNSLKWPHLLIPAATPISLVDGTQQYSLADNFKWPSRFWLVDPNNGEPIYLKQWKTEFNNKNTGTTLFYRIKKKDIGTATARPVWVIDLESIPNGAFVGQYTSLYYDYYYQATNLSGDDDLTKFDEDTDSVIVLGAAIILTAKQDDQRGFAMLGQMYLDAKADMVQRAIEFYGVGIIVKPGLEITETPERQLRDYGRSI